MGSLYRSQHELVFVFKHGAADRTATTSSSASSAATAAMSGAIPGPTPSPADGEEGNLLALHPTVKPVAMVADAILDCTARGDIVLDAFLGSGTTVIAAERTGRRCYALELDPALCRHHHAPLAGADRRDAPVTPRAAAALMTSRARRRQPMPSDDERDYAVGYGKPPRHTRFEQGRSGNPRGRPPGSKNLSTLLSEALNEPVIVTENGGRRKITKREAIVTQLVNRSAKADLRAIQILLGMLRDIEGRAEPGACRIRRFHRGRPADHPADPGAAPGETE